MDPYNPIIVDLMDRKRKQTMLDDLKHFKAPPATHWLLAIPILILVAIACHLDAPQVPVAKAEAPSGHASSPLTLPMAHPLGCPEEDAWGRVLQVAIKLPQERRWRCYYGK